MSQQIIADGETGLNARNAINANFTELYNNLIIPIKMLGVAANTQQAIIANTFIAKMFITSVVGMPTLRIGTAANGTDIMPDTPIGGFNEVDVSKYFSGATILFFTFSGGAGTVNVRINVLYNFY